MEEKWIEELRQYSTSAVLLQPHDDSSYRTMYVLNALQFVVQTKGDCDIFIHKYITSISRENLRLELINSLSIGDVIQVGNSLMALDGVTPIETFLNFALSDSEIEHMLILKKYNGIEFLSKFRDIKFMLELYDGLGDSEYNSRYFEIYDSDGNRIHSMDLKIKTSLDNIFDWRFTEGEITFRLVSKEKIVEAREGLDPSLYPCVVSSKPFTTSIIGKELTHTLRRVFKTVIEDLRNLDINI